MKKIVTMIFPILAAIFLVPAIQASAKNLEWEYDEYGKAYWYENGVKQGTVDDALGILGFGTNRGREIYDPVSDSWYWLDSCYNGAKAVNKEVWIPYTYQDEMVMDASGVGRVPVEYPAAMENFYNLCSQSKLEPTWLDAMVARQMLTKSGKWVRYDADGQMMKGWVTIEGPLAIIYPDQAGNTYYYDTITGSMVNGGYFVIDGYWNTFDENGVLIASSNPAHDTGVAQASDRECINWTHNYASETYDLRTLPSDFDIHQPGDTWTSDDGLDSYVMNDDGSITGTHYNLLDRSKTVTIDTKESETCEHDWERSVLLDYAVNEHGENYSYQIVTYTCKNCGSTMIFYH